MAVVARPPPVPTGPACGRPRASPDCTTHPATTAPLLERVVSALAAAAWRVCADVPGELAPATGAPGAAALPGRDAPCKRPRSRPPRSPVAPVVVAAPVGTAMPPPSPPLPPLPPPPASPPDDTKRPSAPAPELARRFGEWIRGDATAMLAEAPGPDAAPPSPPPPPPSTRAALPDAPVPATALQHAAHALAEVFAHILGAQCWDPAFARGARPRPCAANRPVTRFLIQSAEDAPRVRRLATEHLSAFQADGWNVLIGATELARHWALPNSRAREARSSSGLNRPTRMRLAVCLATSWHFQRGVGSSRFPRDYCIGDASLKPSGGGDWSFELARVGYLFLTAEERSVLGPWPTAYVVPLQNELMAMQVALVVGAPVFSLLVRNPQVEAEHRLEALFQEGRISSHTAMRARALVPLVLRVAWLVDGACRYVTLMSDTPLSVASGALACAGWMLQLSTRSEADGVARWFSDDELHMAIALLSVVATTPADKGALTGCCANPLAPAARFATPGAAERALRLASAAAAGKGFSLEVARSA